MSSDRPDGSHVRRRLSISLGDLLSPPGRNAQQIQGSNYATRITDSPPGISTQWHSSYSGSDQAAGPESPIDPTALQSALPPELWQPAAEGRHFEFASVGALDTASSYADEPSNQDFPDSDRVPLTAGVQPISGSRDFGSHGLKPHDGIHAASSLGKSSARDGVPRGLGLSLDPNVGSAHYGMPVAHDSYRLSRSPSNAGALQRAGSIVRAMSQRVVNISGESEGIDLGTPRHRSRSPQGARYDCDRSPTGSLLCDSPYPQQTKQQKVSTEKTASVAHFAQTSLPHGPPPNPLRGHTLGLFSPSSRVRLWLCGVLIHPYTEPVILMLIVLQTILLAVESAPNVFADGNGRPDTWGKRPIDWAMLGLFIVFTLELVARTIVSGFFLNAAEYSTIDRKMGLRAAITKQYRAVFQPERQASVRGDTHAEPQPSAFTRSFTTLMQGQQALPKTLEEQQRLQLARRAFLRHSFNRLDFLAVVSFWISFVLGIAGIEHRYHLYVFKMLSCLRILRLLALTHGTAIILRSLKKAAPLLVRVAFLVGFFWLLFAIIGVQSFKSSLSRQCVWLDPLEPKNLQASFTNDMQFCGGYKDNTTGNIMPWVKFGDSESLDDLITGTANGKGFICPRGSLCLQQESPFNGTLSFDNIFQSLELVFVIMSANTFSDLMYYTMGSDFLQAALFFGAGIMIMMLWLTNLLIAVITSSFQVIREESKSSAFTVDPEPAAQSTPKARSRKPSTLQRVYDKTYIAWILVIAFGLLCQCFRSSTMSRSRETFIDLAEVVVTIILDAEIVIRFAAHWRRFHLSWRNLFDLGLAVMTTVILIPGIRNSRAYQWLSVFQILRVYRVVLAIPVTRGLIFLVLGNAAGIANLMLFVFLMTFLVAIFASQLFRVIQENFDVSEDEKRLEQVKAFLQRKELGHASSNIALSTIFSFGRSRRRKDPLDYGPAMMEMLLKDAVVRDFLNDDPTDSLQEHGGRAPVPQRSATSILGTNVKPGLLSELWGRFVRHWSEKEPNPFYSNIRFDGPNDTLDPRQMARQAVSATSARRKAQREYLARHPRYNDSLYIFRPKSSLRHLCQRLVGPARGMERFDGVEPNKVAWYAVSVFTYAVVVAMVVLACVTTPLYQKEYREKHPDVVWNWFVWTDLAFALVFTAEASIKVIADGFIWTPNAYLRSSWGIIDGLVLVTLWINVVTLLINDGAISRAVGAFKALRALRLLNVSDSARDTFHSLIIVGWWKLLGAAFISLSLLIPFAVYGLNLFNGLMVTCNDSDGISILDGCFGEYSSTPFKSEWPMLAPRVAANPYFNFDDFGSSLFTLFQIVSQEGWTDVSFAAQGIVGRGMQPQALFAQGNALFFVVFNLMATVFVLTLFISVFMRNYTEQTGVAFLTSEQRSWLELRKLLRHISPSKSSLGDSEKAWKKWCHKRAIEKRGKWYQAITIVLVLHLLLLVAEFRSEPAWWIGTRVFVFLLFMLVYLSNIAIRILGLGWARFRRSSWDLYSLITVSGAFVATVTLLIADTRTDTYVQLHKFFLVAIVLLLIPRNDALDQLFKTAAASLTTIGNLLATWLVFFLVFAIAMTQTFSLTRFGGGETNNINFRTVPKALILLFRMSLGEGWNKIMEDYAEIEPPLCVEQSRFFDSDCGSKAWARGLFVSWNIVSMYIFVNLFVSLIYESFSYVYQRSSGVAVVDRDEIRRFKEAWRSVDPAGTGFITKEVFPRLLGELSGVFQMRIYQPEDSVRQILDDVRDGAQAARHMSMAATSAYNEIDIDRLNRRLALLEVDKIRERRRRFKIFFGEVLAAADPDKGIAFADVLMILAHYNIINDSKSLKLEEFLRRRARLQRVDEEIRRKVVQGFFDTLYWTRKFKRHMERKRASRMSGVPELTIPNILVDADSIDDEGRNSFRPEEGSPVRWTHLSAGEGAGQETRPSSAAEAGHGMTGHQHPLSRPRSPPLMTPHQGATSGFSFELYEPEGRQQGQDARQGTGRESLVSPSQARDMLDDSVWMESIRRSVTLRRPERGSRRYGDED